MFQAIIDYAKTARRRFPAPSGRLLEVGSYDVNGSIRPAFQDATEYIGIDQAAGPGVDLALSAHDILTKFAPASFDTVVCCEMLEHDPTPWVSIDQMHKVLRPGGYLFISSPTYGFPVHRFPKDYYRYGEDAFREVFFAGMTLLCLNEVRDHAGYPVLCGLGVKGVGVTAGPNISAKW